MRTVNFFIIVFGTSLTYVHCKPANSYSTRLLPNDIIRVKKRQDDYSAGYLEQCGIVTFPKAQQGVVNVLAFLDSSWPYSHRQAIMLKMLNERLQKSGLPDTLFFVVNVDPSSARTVDNSEDDIEREAWLGVSPEEIETFADIVKTTDSLALSMTSQIQLIQDNEDLEIWKDLRGSRDQVLVIDRCGKLTYQVIVPWSILHFPYVKAAILSTYKDEPCGPCDVIHNTRDPLKYRDDANPQIDTPSSDSGFKSTAEEYLQNYKDDHVSDVPEPDLGSVLESSTTDTSESGSTTTDFISESIDVIGETTTEFDKFDSPDNYTTMNFGAAIANELTTLESATLITAEDITEIESEATTINNIFADSETIDFTNTTTSHPINNDEITNFQLNEKSPISQNSGDDPRDIEEKIGASSTDIINSDTTDSKYPVSYYETTENIYIKNYDKYTTVPKTPKSNTSDIINTDTTDSKYPVSYYETTENIYIKNDDKYTTVPKTPKSNTPDIINTDTTDSKYPVSYYETTENIYIKNDDKYTTVPKTPKSNTPDIINTDTTDSKYPVSYHETTENIYIKNGDKYTTVPKTPKSNTSDIINTDTTDSKYPVSYHETTENIYIKNGDKYTTVPKTPKSNTPDIINTDTTDSKYPVSYYETTENIYIKNDDKYTNVPETPESSTSKFFMTPKKSMSFDNNNSTESLVDKKEDTTIFTNNNANQLDSLAGNIYIKNQSEDTTAKETSELSTSSFFEIQEKTTDFYIENSTQSSVEKEDTTITINSDTIQLDGIALTSNPDELPTSEKSNENMNSESLQNNFDDNSENQDTSQLSDMPLRIIMHAPHFHVDGDSTRMHEYLVLKTGSSDYHRHFASYDATRLYRGPQDFQETPEYLRNDEIERKKWPMTNVIYNKDESPGLYGEVADYWKNSGGQDNYDYTEETETSGIKQNTEEPSPDERISMKPSPTKNTSLTENGEIVEQDSAVFDDGSDKIPERLQADFADENVTDKQIWSDETLNAEEEEKRSKLIAHYSKLLPWIYYVLDK